MDGPIIVTGGAGFIGSNVVAALNARGVDEIVILPVSPRSLYAYWELTPETQQRMRDAAGVEDASLVIHVQEIVTEEGEVVQHLARRIPVESPVGEYFIHEMTPGRLHVCMLGWAGPDGDFTAVVHSNPAPTPPDTPSSRLDERWTTLQPPTARETHAPATTVPAHPVDLDPLEIAMLRFHGRDATGIGLMDDHFAYRPEGSSDLSALAHVDREDRADPLPNGSADPPAADPEEPPL